MNARSYDIDACTVKARAALQHLIATQQPGERKGMGKKTDVLQALKAELVQLTAQGYTSQQIAAALTDGDVFKVLPKSITQLVAKKRSAPRKMANRAPTVGEPIAKAATKQSSQKAVTEPPSAGTFTVKQDAEDL